MGGEGGGKVSEQGAGGGCSKEPPKPSPCLTWLCSPVAEKTGKVLGEFCRCYKEQYGVALFNSVRYEIEGNGGPQAQLLHRKVRARLRVRSLEPAGSSIPVPSEHRPMSSPKPGHVPSAPSTLLGWNIALVPLVQPIPMASCTVCAARGAPWDGFLPPTHATSTPSKQGQGWPLAAAPMDVCA